MAIFIRKKNNKKPIYFNKKLLEIFLSIFLLNVVSAKVYFDLYVLISNHSFRRLNFFAIKSFKFIFEYHIYYSNSNCYIEKPNSSA